jgi:predicted DNA binding CopG/RHH family protein
MTSSYESDRLEVSPGLSPAEEAEWWDAHKDFWDAPDIEFEVIEPQEVRPTADTHLRLPEDMLAALKAAADRRGISYHWLIRTWLDERLAAETPST